MPLLDLPVVDSHVHLWNPSRFQMSWLEGNDLLNRRYEVEEFTEANRAVGVEAFVFVETGVKPQYAFLEAEWAAKSAALEPRLKGIVAAAPLEHGKRVRYYLERLIATSPLVKGVRRLLQDEPDPYFCLQSDFVDGVQLLSELGLSFDICIRHHQLPGVIELVKRCSQTSFILDHSAKPAIKSGEFDPWREHIRELAKLPNVACKISGLVTEADHHGWTEAILEPYVAHVLEVFGEDRVLFGSDWPVMLLASNYGLWVQTLDRLTSHLPQGVRRKLWSENARQYYRL